MKSVIALALVLFAAALPPNAAALDYGQNQHFLAAETHAPSLPAPVADNAPFTDPTSQPGGNDAPSSGISGRMQHASAPASARRKASAASAQGAGGERPPNVQSPLSWQSLLPGSIQ